MEKSKKRLITSPVFEENLKTVYNYGAEAFGDFLADIFINRLQAIINELEHLYDLHPECKYLPTKGKIYRNIIFGKYIVIYRIKPSKVEILTLLHTSKSIKKIKTARSIKI